MARSAAYVRDVFTAIAPRYDFLNHLLSLNVDRSWRRTAVARLGWESKPDGTYLDLCAGTLDLAAVLARQVGFRGRVIGADFAVPMLAQGKDKASRTVPVAADALQLPFPAARFDGALVGFGVRNLADLDGGLREAARVLKPGARFVILRRALWHSITYGSSSPRSTKRASSPGSRARSRSTRKSRKSPTAA